MARNALEALHRHYPMHSWYVRIDGGCIIVYNYGIDGRHGMVQHLATIQGDDTTFIKSIVRAAGELLERAQLRRSIREFGMPIPGFVEGIDPRKRRVPIAVPLSLLRNTRQ